MIGALRVSLSAETAQFEAGMKRAQRTAATTESAFKRSFGNIGSVVKAGLAGLVSGLSVGLVVQGAKAALEYASSLGEMAEQLGVTSKELQTYRYIASQTGVSQESMDKGLARLTLTIGKAAAGSEQAQVGFNALGISIRNADGSIKTAGQILPEIADKYKNVDSAATRAALTFQFFGKAGQNLSRVLSGGSGEINALAAAAENLGIVLSAEQIEKADETADRLEALMTVLKTKIAGEVADNSDSILDFANALFSLVRAAEQAKAALVSFQQNYNLPNLFKGDAFGKGIAGRSVTTDLSTGGSALAIAKRMGLKVASSGSSGGAGGDPGQFLAGGGGRGKKDNSAEEAERKRLQALRDAYQFDQELLRAQQDVLRAQQQLSTDYSERAAISIQLLNLDQQGFQREMEYAVASGDLSKAQAAQLEAEYAKKDALERQAVLAEEEAQRKEDYNHLEELDFDLQRDILESQLQLATTAKQQRDIRLRLLELDYRAERARLDTILADEKASYAAKEEARRRLAALNKTEGNDRAAVAQGSRDPLQAYFDRIPKNADEMNEALNGVAANGLQNLEDGLVGILTGTESVADAFKKMASEIISQLIRIQVQQFILKVAQGLGVPQAGGMSSGGPVGYASGGWVSGRGTGTSDSIPAMLSNGEFVINAKATKKFLPLLETINSGNSALMAAGGMAIPRYSSGARLSVGDEGARGGGMTVHAPITIMGNATRETTMQMGAKLRGVVASANRKGA